MFDTTFTHTSATPLPSTVQIDQALSTLHNFETIIRLSPDCRGCKPIPPPATKNGAPKTNGHTSAPSNAQIQYYEVEDDLPFIPKRLWSGGVRYTADFVPTNDGCDITVHAPGGFTSTNHWRLLRETLPEDSAPALERVQSKDLLYAQTGGGGGWYIQIVSDARCSKTFAGFVKGFLKNSQLQLQSAFIERVKEGSTKPRRPTLGRRRSSEF